MPRRFLALVPLQSPFAEKENGGTRWLPANFSASRRQERALDSCLVLHSCVPPQMPSHERTRRAVQRMSSLGSAAPRLCLSLNRTSRGSRPAGPVPCPGTGWGHTAPRETAASTPREVVSYFPGVALTNDHKLGGWKPQNFFSCSSGCQESEIKAGPPYR